MSLRLSVGFESDRLSSEGVTGTRSHGLSGWAGGSEKSESPSMLQSAGLAVCSFMHHVRDWVWVKSLPSLSMSQSTVDTETQLITHMQLITRERQ